jgi:hypothetical protein
MERSELYKKFNPVVIEALALVTMNEINLIREHLGLPLRTKTQMINAIETKLDNLPKPDIPS